MVGMDPTKDNGEVVHIRAAQARRSAGITDYEADWLELQERMDARGMPVATRLSIPIRDPLTLPAIAETLHRLANEITAIQAETGMNDYTKLVEVNYSTRDAERRLREL